jgi:hypothetical protein
MNTNINMDIGMAKDKDTGTDSHCPGACNDMDLVTDKDMNTDMDTKHFCSN